MSNKASHETNDKFMFMYFWNYPSKVDLLLPVKIWGKLPQLQLTNPLLSIK